MMSDLSPNDMQTLSTIMGAMPDDVVERLNRVMKEAHGAAEGMGASGRLAASLYCMVVAAYQMGSSGAVADDILAPLLE